ncbi:MAG: hypothetical protein LQ350_008224 [Teloschistes chrysophthalmus]|nr:MAG: hypothetical protein LQ350_008224 [Niorma chrysophthalma]
MAIAPVLLHYLVVAQGRISYADAELALQDYYFAFLFLQVFIVVSVSSSAATVLSSLRYDFVSFAALLALNLPKAANYFLSYIILQAFSVSAGALLQAGRLLRFAATSFYGNTPRGVWEAIQKPQIRWGTFFPIYTNLAVITIIYSVVTPLILVVSILAFYSFWAVQRYNVLHVAAFNTDTGGLTYIKALFQLFLGLYSMELYLTGLFFLVRDENNRVVCTAQGLIMILAGLLTATYHVLLKRAYEPLINTVPVMLSSGTIGSVPVSHSRQVAQRKWVAKIRERATRLHQTILELIEEDISLLRDHEQAEALAAGTKAITIRDEALSAQQPTVWLPRDNLGVSNFEIEQTREVSPRILISDEDFGLGTDGRIKCNRNPFTKEKAQLDFLPPFRVIDRVPASSTFWVNGLFTPCFKGDHVEKGHFRHSLRAYTYVLTCPDTERTRKSDVDPDCSVPSCDQCPAATVPKTHIAAQEKFPLHGGRDQERASGNVDLAELQLLRKYHVIDTIVAEKGPEELEPKIQRDQVDYREVARTSRDVR